MQSAAVSVTTMTSKTRVYDIRHFYLAMCRACGFRVTEITLHEKYQASAVAHHPIFGTFRLEIRPDYIGFTCSAPRSSMYGLFVFDGKTWNVYPPEQLNELDFVAIDIVLRTCPELRNYLSIGMIDHDSSKLLPKDEENRPDSPYMFELITKLMLLFTRTI